MAISEDSHMDSQLPTPSRRHYLMTSHKAAKLDDDEGPIQFKIYGRTPAEPGVGPMRHARPRQGGTPFAAATHSLQRPPTRPPIPISGQKKKSALPQDPFRRKIFIWLERYYNEFGVADENTAFHRPDIVGLQKPSALKAYIAIVDASVRNGGARLRKARQYDDRVRFYKALRHLYHYITGTDFPSQIDDDGDWIMGYLRVTYPYHPRSS